MTVLRMSTFLGGTSDLTLLSSFANHVAYKIWNVVDVSIVTLLYR